MCVGLLWFQLCWLEIDSFSAFFFFSVCFRLDDGLIFVSPSSVNQLAIVVLAQRPPVARVLGHVHVLPISMIQSAPLVQPAIISLA